MERGADASEEEKIKYQGIVEEKQKINEERTIILTPNASGNNTEKIEKIKQLIFEKEILEKKNRCMLKFIECQLQNT